VRGEGFFEAVHDRAAEAAAGAGGFVDLDLRVGPVTARFRFAGPALVERLTPALRPLALAGRLAAPDFTALFFDSATTQTPMVRAPFTEGELRLHGELPPEAVGGSYAHYNVYHHALTLVDAAGRRGVYWIGDAADVPDHETASPLFALFHAWLARHGLYHVHAAGVGRPDGGVLLVGANGAGKSNTALACIGSSLGFAGDDRVLVGAEPEPTLVGLYGTAKTNPEDEGAFPALEVRGGGSTLLSNGKRLHDVAAKAPEAWVAGFPIRAVVMPKVVSGAGGRMRPGDPSAALRILGPPTMLRWPTFGRATLAALGRVFRAVPCWELECGPDRGAIPGALEAVLAASGAAPRSAAG